MANSSRYINNTRIYERRRLIENYEKEYTNNPGSLLLARGIIEHIHALL